MPEAQEAQGSLDVPKHTAALEMTRCRLKKKGKGNLKLNYYTINKTIVPLKGSVFKLVQPPDHFLGGTASGSGVGALHSLS